MRTIMVGSEPLGRGRGEVGICTDQAAEEGLEVVAELVQSVKEPLRLVDLGKSKPEDTHGTYTV